MRRSTLLLIVGLEILLTCVKIRKEMSRLQECDDYESRVKPGNLLSGQYHFHEAANAYHLAEMVRADDPMLYLFRWGLFGITAF